MQVTHEQQAERTLRNYKDLRGSAITSLAWRSVRDFTLSGDERPAFLLLEDAFTDEVITKRDTRLQRCAEFFSEISSNKPRPRPATIEAIGVIGTGHPTAVRTGVGDYYMGIIGHTGDPTLTVFEDDTRGRVGLFDISTGHDAFVPKNIRKPDEIELREGQLIILRGDATFAEIDGDSRLRKATIPSDLTISPGESITAITAHAALREADVWLTHRQAANIGKFNS